MKCPNCGAEIDNNEKICQYCGSQITLEMQKEREELRKKGCPKCGSTKIHFSREKQGEVQVKNGKQIVYKTIGICDDCGNTWIPNQGTQKRGPIWLWVLGWIFIFPVPLTILMVRNKKLNKAAKIGIIVGAWILYMIWMCCGGILSLVNKDSDNKSTVEETKIIQTEGNSDSEKTTENIIEEDIEVENIKIQINENTLFLGQEISGQAVILPENATNKSVKWYSEDESVATIDSKGNVIAVGGGTTVIVAEAVNGIKDTFEITVDASKRIMNLRVTHPRKDDNNIGDEWSFHNEINGERVVGNKYTVSVGDKLNFYSEYTESDDNPDVGSAKKTYTVTEEDLNNGFTVTMDVYVQENGGRNSGQKAYFVATYTFTP